MSVIVVVQQPKIVEYSVAIVQTKDGKAQSTISEEVADLIAEGWQPFGSLSSIVSGRDLILCQPMVKYEAVTQATPTTVALAKYAEETRLTSDRAPG